MSGTDLKTEVAQVADDVAALAFFVTLLSAVPADLRDNVAESHALRWAGFQLDERASRLMRVVQ